MDILLKVLLDEEPVLIHCEIQTDDSVYPNMVRRNVGYLGRCYEKYGLPIYSFVLYLRSTAGHSDPAGISKTCRTTVLLLNIRWFV